MSQKPFLLALDQGTPSTRAILFDADARPVASHALANTPAPDPFGGHRGAHDARTDDTRGAGRTGFG